MKNFALILCLFALAGCSLTTKPSEPIINSGSITSGEITTGQVSLGMLSGDDFILSGSYQDTGTKLQESAESGSKTVLYTYNNGCNVSKEQQNIISNMFISRGVEGIGLNSKTREQRTEEENEMFNSIGPGVSSKKIDFYISISSFYQNNNIIVYNFLTYEGPRPHSFNFYHKVDNKRYVKEMNDFIRLRKSSSSFGEQEAECDGVFYGTNKQGTKILKLNINKSFTPSVIKTVPQGYTTNLDGAYLCTIESEYQFTGTNLEVKISKIDPSLQQDCQDTKGQNTGKYANDLETLKIIIK